jgi:hypothetical protein
MSGVISSILVGTANGCSCVGYQTPNKKQCPMNSSDATHIRKLQVIGVTSSLQVQERLKIDYSQLSDIRLANRLVVPTSKFVGQNFQ